jgi:hypothetical protein
MLLKWKKEEKKASGGAKQGRRFDSKSKEFN